MHTPLCASWVDDYGHSDEFGHGPISVWINQQAKQRALLERLIGYQEHR